MEKMLFFDIDGTLATPGHTPSSATVQAIRKARQKGHKVFLSTGRTLGGVPFPILDIGFDGGIFSAGGSVMVGDAVLSQHFMSDDLLKQILPLLQNEKIFYILETADGKFKSANAKDVLAKLDLSQSGSEMQRLVQEVFFGRDLADIASYQGQKVYKVAFFSSNQEIAEELSHALKGAAKVVRFDNLVPDFPLTAGEISDYTISKGAALQDVCRYHHKTEEDCIAFGDSMNDAEILESAGLGIAMGNAEERVKALADLVCDTCENDGVAKALYGLNLIP